MVKQRSLGPDMDDGSDASSAFLDALRTRAMDDLHLAALDYGIVLKDLGMCYSMHFAGVVGLYLVQLLSTDNSRVTPIALGPRPVF